MISRLSAFAAVFAVLTTATLALAATSQQRDEAAPAAAVQRINGLPVVQLERVVIIGHRTAPG